MTFATRLLLVGALALTFSCSPNFYCRKCLESGKLKPDTIRESIAVEVPKVSIDTVLVGYPEMVPDTLVIHKDRLTIKYRDLPGPTVYLAGECAPDTVTVTVDKIITNEIKTGYSLMHLIGTGVAVLLVMCAALFIVAKAR